MDTYIIDSTPRVLLLLSMCMLICWWDFGIFTANGVFFGGFLEYYQSDRSPVAAVTGLFTACSQGFAIFGGLMTNRFGVVKIAFIGTILVPLGLLLSVFATSIYQILIYYGVITAVGTSMLYMCSVTILRRVCSGSYKKWLPISLVLHSMCVSFAGLTYPFLITHLIDQFSLPGTFLILAGICLNNICISLLFFFNFRSQNDHVTEQNVTSDTEGVTISTSDVSSNATLNGRQDSSSSNSAVEIELRTNNEQDIAENDVSEKENSPQTNDNETNEIITKNHTCKACPFILHIQKIPFPHVPAHLMCIITTAALGLGTECSYIAMIVDIFKSKGHSTERAILVFVPLNICNVVYRLLPGILTKVNPIIFMTLYCVCGAFGKFALLYLTNYYSMLASVSLSTAILGGLIAAATIEIASSVEMNKFSLAFGLIWTGSGLITISFSPALGAVRDATFNYDTVLIIIGGMQTVCVILCILCWTLKRNYFSKCCGL